MLSRKVKFKTKKQSKLKLSIGVLFLTAVVLGNIGVAFADQDISSLLTNWFSKKGTESVSTIEKAIMTEKEQQKQRLKEELQLEIDKSSKQLQQFTEDEKEKRIQGLRDYADQLAANINVDNSKEKQKVIDEMDSIIQKAINELDKVDRNKKDSSTNVDPKTGDQAPSAGDEVNNSVQAPSVGDEVNNSVQVPPTSDEIKNVDQTPSSSVEVNSSDQASSISDEVKNLNKLPLNNGQVKNEKIGSNNESNKE